MGRHLASLLLLLRLLQHFGDGDGSGTLEETPLQFTHFQYNVTVHESAFIHLIIQHWCPGLCVLNSESVVVTK